MRKKRQYIYLMLIASILIAALLIDCSRNQNPAQEEPPAEASYFDLLGISKDEIQSIEIWYGTSLEEEKELLTEISQDDPLYEELLDTLQQVQLTYAPNRTWSEMKNHYQYGNAQLVFDSGDQKYELPVLDIYEKQMGKPHPESWAVYQDTFVYTANAEELWDSKLYQGLALYIERAAAPYAAGAGLTKIEVPPYYGIAQNAHTWSFDCNYHTMFTKSDYIFRGKILSASWADGYEVEVIECYQGDCQSGDQISYRDGTGYDAASSTYYALVNESERALSADGEYLFFLQKSPFDSSSLYLTDRQCGVAEILDGQVWPIFNAKPGTSWFVGQTLDEVKAEVSQQDSAN